MNDVGTWKAPSFLVCVIKCGKYAMYKLPQPYEFYGESDKMTFK